MLAPTVNILHSQNLRFRCPPHLKSSSHSPSPYRTARRCALFCFGPGALLCLGGQTLAPKTAKQRTSFTGAFCNSRDNGAWPSLFKSAECLECKLAQLHPICPGREGGRNIGTSAGQYACYPIT